MEKISICFSCNDKFAQHLGVTLTSILKNKSNSDLIDVYILDGGISQDNKNKIHKLKSICDFGLEFLTVNNETLKNLPLEDKPHLSIETYYRLLLPGLCPDIKRIIYLDSDLIIRTSLRELFETDINNCYFAGVPNISEKTQCERLNIEKYCNAGVIVMNLEYFREKNALKTIFEWINENYNSIVYYDQDILNAALADGVKYIEKKWNTQVLPSLNYTKEVEENAAIIHFISWQKPWNYTILEPFAHLYYDYLKLTPWRDEVRKIYLQVLPGAIIRKCTKFVFEARNENAYTKVITLLGKKFQIKRRSKQAITR